MLRRIADFLTSAGQTLDSITLSRDVAPLEGTNMSLWNSIIPNWWSENGMSTGNWLPGNAILAHRTWVAARCIQMNAQQIASMPLRFQGSTEPAWVSSPDPNWYPNGIADAIFSIISQLYGWGFACLYVTDSYYDGYPRTWTVLPSSALHIDERNGRRVYKTGDTELDPSRVIQIDRDPGHHLHGTSALRAYWQQANGLLAAGNQSMSVSQGGIPQAVLKSQRRLTAAQAESIQTKWMERTQNRNGAPPVLPPDIDFEVLSINPADLSLLETQEFNAKAVMTAFGVPAVLMNMALQGGLTYQNPAALGEMWWRFELRPTAKRVADAFTAQLLPAGQYVWFDAADTFAALTPESDRDDPQAANDQPQTIAPPAAKASPAQQPPRLTAIGGRT